MSSTKLRSVFLIIVVSVCLLQACTRGVRIIPSPEYDTTLKPNQGVVAVRLADTSSGIQRPYNRVRFAPKNLDYENNTPELLAKADFRGGVTSSTIIAPVSAGQYSVSGLDLWYYIDPYFFSGFADATPELGTFRVEPGTLTNLGTLIYYPRFDGKKFYQTLVRNDSFEGAQKHIKQNYRGIYESLTNPDESLKWDNSQLEDEHWNDYIRVAQNPVAFDSVYTREDGDIVFLSRLGVFVERSDTGEWSMDSVPMDIQLTAYDENAKGARVLGGEFGVIYYKESAGGDWGRIDPPVPDKAIELLFLSDGGEIVAGVKYHWKVDLYRKESVQSVDWEKLAMYAPRIGWKMGERSAKYEEDVKKAIEKRRMEVHSLGGFMYMRKPTITINHEIFQMNDRLSEIKPYQSIKPATHVESAGEYLVAFEQYPLSRDLYISFDGGVDWEDIDESVENCKRLRKFRGLYCSIDPKIRRVENIEFLGQPHFWNPQHGYGLVQITHKYADNEKIVVETHDGGKSWTNVETEQSVENCTTLVPTIGPGRLLLQCHTGHFYLSEDGGIHWRVDREPISSL